MTKTAALAEEKVPEEAAVKEKEEQKPDPKLVVV